MKLYQFHNLPSIKPQLNLQCKYVIEDEYQAVSDWGIYASLPNEHDVHIYELTQGYLCMLEKALYSIDKLNWCVYALFMESPERINRDCILNLEDHSSNHESCLEVGFGQ